MICKMRGIVAAGCLAIAGAAPVSAADFCFGFPLPNGSEEVCATGVFPRDPIEVGPGDSVALPLVEYTNHTQRDMTFTIESTGSLIVGMPHAVTLAPGDEASFTNVVILKTDDYAPIGTNDTIQVGWSAFGSLSGEEDFEVTVQRNVQFVVGPDSDGDGLVDSWESDGYDPNADGVVDVDLSALGADPMHKDLFVEIDWEAAIPPNRTNLQKVREAFAAAPIDAGGVANPDGLPGIDVHFDTGGLTDGLGNLIGDPEFAGPLGRGTQIADGPWVFGATCFGGLDNDRACDPVNNPCDLAMDGDGLGVCEVGFYRAKAMYFETFPRRMLFRYVIMNLGAGAGQGELGGDDIWLGSTADTTLMHEMGHTLNLSHGGPPEENGVRNCEPNYVSIMNYRYPRITRLDGMTLIDFSPARFSAGGRALAPLDLDETSLVEAALDPSDAEHLIAFVGPPEVCSALCNGGPKAGRRCASDGDCADAGNPANNGTCGGLAQQGQSCASDAQCGGGRCGGLVKTAPIGQSIDWNRNGVLGEVVAQNVDGTFTAGNCGNEGFAAELVPLTGYDDWANVRLRFRPSKIEANAPEDPILEPELTDAQIVEALEEMSTANLAIAKLGPAGALEAGESATLTYDLAVSNAGPNVAGTVRVHDELPDGFAASDLEDRCTELDTGTVECSAIAFLPGDETTFSLEIEGTPTCRDGLPQRIENVATVENASEFAGDDPDPDDNRAAFTTAVVDTTPPELTVDVAPATLWPADHELEEIAVTLSATDACDDDPAIRLVSAVSDEPDDAVGNGDGKTTGDVQGADLGTADGALLLRAERSGGGDGRTYTLTYEAKDRSGNVASVSRTVTVPKSQSR